MRLLFVHNWQKTQFSFVQKGEIWFSCFFDGDKHAKRREKTRAASDKLILEERGLDATRVELFYENVN